MSLTLDFITNNKFLIFQSTTQHPMNVKQKNKMSSQNITNSQKLSLSFQTPEMEAIMKLKQKHEKNVEQTVKVIEDLNFNKFPQKCFLHQNNFTLYCQNCQKPLCASCMYQNQAHKIHKVLPLGNCTNQLIRDCGKFQKQLQFIVGNMTGLVKHVNDGIAKLDKQFPHLVWKIQENYKKLHQFLVQRQKQHVNQLRYYKDRMKYQHGALSTQLNKISMFIQQKINQYSKRNQPDSLLVKRNIYESLKNSAKIIGDQLNIKQQPEPKLHFQVFTQIQDFIYAKLPRLFVKELKKQQRSTKSLKNNSKQKLSYSPVSKNKKQHTPSSKNLNKTQNSGEKEKTNKKNSPNKLGPQQKQNKNNMKTPSKRQRSKSNTNLNSKNSSQRQKTSKSKSISKRDSNSKSKRQSPQKR